MTEAISERVIRTDIEMQVAARDGQIHLLFNEKNQAGESVPAYTAPGVFAFDVRATVGAGGVTTGGGAVPYCTFW